jgi:hypothetical protein
MTAQKMTIPGGEVTIIGEPNNINYFINTDLVPDSEANVVNRTSTVRAHTRRQYAKDPTAINVSQSNRTWLFDPGRRNGSAIPGNPFILDDGTEKRQFHYTGNFIDLHAFMVGEAAMDLTLYSQSAAYSITAAAQG